MDQPGESVKTVNAMKARQNFGQMLEEVYYKGDHFVIERAGKPMAALVPLSKLRELQKHSDPAKIGHEPGKVKTRQSKTRRS